MLIIVSATESINQAFFFSGRKTRDTCACARSKADMKPETLYVQEPMRKNDQISLIWDLDWSPVKDSGHTEPLLLVK